METEIRGHKIDIEKLKTDFNGLAKDVREKSEKSINDNLSTAAKVQMESMLARVESKHISEQLQKLMKNFEENDAVLKEKF